MIGLFGYWPTLDHHDQADVASRMGAALRADSAHAIVPSVGEPVTVGAVTRMRGADVPWRIESLDGQAVLWVAGHVFSTRAPLECADSPEPRRWQRQLVEGLHARGLSALAGLNGDFQLAFWDRHTQALTLAVDRFCSSPLYWASTASGFSFAFGVRGVVMAPGVSREPDIDAIREAVTFGGHRLGDRTNIAGVRMIRPAHALQITTPTDVTARPYWSWSDIPAPVVHTLDAAVEELRPRWRAAVARRLTGAACPGQTLSGGRDSRVILAEAAQQASSWTAYSYGVPGCDDVRLAERAARAVGAHYRFLPLYDVGAPDWLERRTSRIQHTDGLIDLIDLMHLEHREVLTSEVDAHLPGYLGDVIVGTTYDRVTSYETAMLSLSFTGAPIALPWDDARERLCASSVWDGSGSARALLFEHKFPQAIGRSNAALSMWVDVRRPFLDHDVVDLAMGLSDAVRCRLYDAWARSTYPAVFARIPIQKTGVPVGSSSLRMSAARATRVGRRLARRATAAIGIGVAPHSRTYTADEEECAKNGVRRRIEDVILRPGSIVAGIWGRERIKRLLTEWFDQRGGAAQVVGALYTWEAYHRDLPEYLRGAERRAER